MWGLCSSPPDSVFLLSHLRALWLCSFPWTAADLGVLWCVPLAPQLLFRIACDDFLQCWWFCLAQPWDGNKGQVLCWDIQHSVRKLRAESIIRHRACDLSSSSSHDGIQLGPCTLPLWDFSISKFLLKITERVQECYGLRHKENLQTCTQIKDRKIEKSKTCLCLTR